MVEDAPAKSRDVITRCDDSVRIGLCRAVWKGWLCCTGEVTV